MKNNIRTSDSRDEISSSLYRCGVFSPYLERMQKVSCEMNELEWKLIRGAAAASSTSTQAKGE